jgi:hypothetical protein
MTARSLERSRLFGSCAGLCWWIALATNIAAGEHARTAADLAFAAIFVSGGLWLGASKGLPLAITGRARIHMGLPWGSVEAEPDIGMRLFGAILLLVATVLVVLGCGFLTTVRW